MSESWNIIGWGIIILVVAVAAGLLILFFKAYYDQWKTDWVRKRAHAGKVKCGEEDCGHIATRQTPLGYYCDTHYLSHIKKIISVGSVSWAHPLNHTMKGGPT